MGGGKYNSSFLVFESLDGGGTGLEHILFRRIT